MDTRTRNRSIAIAFLALLLLPLGVMAQARQRAESVPLPRDIYEPEPISVLKELALDPADPVMDVGEYVVLRLVWTCSVTGRTWPVEPRWPVRWISDDPDAAVVSEDGQLIALAPGQVAVTAIRRAEGPYWVQADTAVALMTVK